MNNVLKYGVMGFGAYLLYEWFQGQGGAAHFFPVAAPASVVPSATAPAATVSPESGTTHDSTGDPVPDTNAAAKAALDALWPRFAAKLQAANVTTGSGLTCDQWNYFYNQAGGAAPDPMNGCVVGSGLPGFTGYVPPNRGMPVPYTTWRSWMTSKGLGVWMTRGNDPVQFSGLGARVWGYGRSYVRSGN